MPQLSEPVNLVNAQAIAKRRGIKIYEEKTSSTEGFASLIKLRIVTQVPMQQNQRKVSGIAVPRSVSGTLFGAEPRIVGIDGYRVDFEPFGYMLIDSHVDKPGMIGQIGTILGSHNINIAGMQLGRMFPSGSAVTVLSVDDPVSPEVLDKLRQVDGVENIRFVDLGGQQ